MMHNSWAFASVMLQSRPIGHHTQHDYGPIVGPISLERRDGQRLPSHVRCRPPALTGSAQRTSIGLVVMVGEIVAAEDV